MKLYTKEGLIQALIDIRNQGWIPTARRNNDGGVGNTLEDLLGIEENNLPIPNAAEWELKAQKKNTTALLTLFHKEPSPRALRFVPSILLPHYGWAHSEAGGRYSHSERSFRQTIRAGRFSNRGFTIRVDREQRKVVVHFDYSEIDRNVHEDWANSVAAAVGRVGLTPEPYWGFDDLFHKAGTKLGNCFFVQASSKRFDGVLHFRYEEMFLLSTFSLERFINAIERGEMYIDFDARTGHNHGTKFRMRKELLPQLYETSLEF